MSTVKYINNSGLLSGVLEEIKAEPAPWHTPFARKKYSEKSLVHDIFERAQMKFLNGNLNYWDVGNMVKAIDEFVWNPYLPKTLKACEASRELTGERLPFGRMVIWRIPPQMFIKPHYDNIPYQHCIVRHIWFLNLGPEYTEVEIAGEKINTTAEVLFQFFPATQKHAFKNNHPTEDWFFLGFDTWRQDPKTTEYLPNPNVRRFLMCSYEDGYVDGPSTK